MPIDTSYVGKTLDVGKAEWSQKDVMLYALVITTLIREFSLRAGESAEVLRGRGKAAGEQKGKRWNQTLRHGKRF